MLGEPGGERRVDEFLSWLRGALQAVGDGSLSLIVSGSIGLRPLVHRLGIPDRINYLDSFRVGPWDAYPADQIRKRLHISSLSNATVQPSPMRPHDGQIVRYSIGFQAMPV